MSNSNEFLNRLSERARNVCSANDILSLDDLENFLASGNSLVNLKGCGLKTRHEIIKTLDNNDSRTEINKNSRYEAVLKNVKEEQVELLEFKFRQLKSELSNRAQNVLNDICDEDEQAIPFIRYNVEKWVDFNLLKNVGKKTVLELNLFREKVVEETIQLGNNSSAKIDLIVEKLDTSLKIKDSEKLPLLVSDLRNRTLNLISFFENFLFSDNYLNVKELMILKYIIDRKFSNSINLSKIADQFGLSRERIRQLKEAFPKNFRNDYSFIKELLPFSFNLQSKIDTNDYFYIGEQPEHFLKCNDLPNNCSILANILSLLENEDFFVLSNRKDLTSIKSPFRYEVYKEYKTLKVNVFIKRDFIKEDLVLDLLNDVFRKISDKIENDFSVNIFDLADTEINQDQADFLINLIRLNFNLEIKKPGFLILKRNTVKKVSEFVYEILESNDKPMQVDEIYTELEKIEPGKSDNVQALRGTINNSSDFIYFGRSSTYGLKVWEETREGIKGGTIKGMVKDFLKQSKRPKHLIEIYRYVARYREETNPRSIDGNLKLDPENSFIFFKSNFIGLRELKGNHNYLPYHKLPFGLGRSISAKVKSEGKVQKQEIVKDFSSRYNLKEKDVEMVVENLVAEGYLSFTNGYYFKQSTNKENDTLDAEILDFFESDKTLLDLLTEKRPFEALKYVISKASENNLEMNMTEAKGVIDNLSYKA